MQFDLKKFFATGKQPYHAEFQMRPLRQGFCRSTDPTAGYCVF